MKNVFKKIKAIFKPQSLKFIAVSTVFGPVDAFELFLESWDKDKMNYQEEFKIMLLDKNNFCLEVSTIAVGEDVCAIADLKIAFAKALNINAASMILAHNKPSGNIICDNKARTIARKFRNVGKAIDIPVIDHLIITKDNYTSLSNEGFLFSN